jgi:hypothetical protein
MNPLRSAWVDAVVGARFLRDAPAFLRRPPPAGSARAEIEARLARRGADLEALVERIGFRRPSSLYGRLLAAAGCEPGDVRRLLAREGVEGALVQLYQAGVYLSVEEFKGRAEVVRGSMTLPAGPDAVRNPAARFHVPARSSGSRGGAGTPILIDLDYIRTTAVDVALVLELWGAAATDKATWEVPGGGAMYRLLEFAACDRRPARWFSRLALDDPGLAPRYRRSAAALRLAGRLGGVPFAAPTLAPLEDPAPILEWMGSTLAAGRRPLLVAMASAAAGLAEAAIASGIDLRGAWVVAAGEPLTAARRASLERAGLGVIARYGAIETGAIGYGCMSRRHDDDLHLLTDVHAVIRLASPSRLPAGTLLLTSLRPSAPFAFLNVSLGDRAALETRACGCPLEAVGWTTHVHDVRSPEKLTAAGANFLDVDVIRILEEVLPRRFGGGAGDYQVVEDEGAAGRPRLLLRVHPRLGDLDERAVMAEFLAALGSASGADAMMARLWTERETFTVERAAPATTRTGKLLHVHRVGR